MTGFSRVMGDDGEPRILCALNATEDCLGYMKTDEMYVDSNGEAWDVCPVCAEWEMQMTGRKG